MSEPLQQQRPSRRTVTILLAGAAVLYLVPTVSDLLQGVPLGKALGIGEIVAGLVGCTAASFLIRRGRR